MKEEKKPLKFSELEVGDTFPPVTYEIPEEKIEEYRRIFGDEEGIPPFLGCLFAFRPLFERYFIQPGTIHAFQEVILCREISERVFTSYGVLKEKYTRRGKNYLVFEITTEDKNGLPVNRIRFGFVVPE